MWNVFDSIDVARLFELDGLFEKIKDSKIKNTKGAFLNNRPPAPPEKLLI
ncbi:MAG: hypothetical protein GY940_26850 [bacterium]|nr:hypothetical protein [bacterium]